MAAEHDGRAQMYQSDHIVASHLRVFDQTYGTKPARHDSYRAVGVVAWIATFAPWTLSNAQQTRVGAYLSKYYARSDYNVDGWWRTAMLSAAHYALNGTLRDIEQIILNVDHHNSGLRLCIYEAMAFVAPLIRWDSPQGEHFRQRVESHVDKRFFYSDSAIVLAVSLAGDPDVKKNWVRALATRGRLGSHDAAVAGDIVKGLPVANPMAAWLFEITALISALLIDDDKAHNNDLTIFTGHDVSVRQRIEHHPLMRSQFVLPDGYSDWSWPARNA